MNHRILTRTSAASLLLVILLIAMTALVSAQVPTQTSGSTSVTGALGEQYAQHWLGISPDQPNANLRFTMTFFPSENSEVLSGFGFWVMTDSDVSAVVTGGRFAENNVAAGEQQARDPRGTLSAQITATGLANYTVVVYNNSTTPVEYTLSVENGRILDDANQVEAVTGTEVGAEAAAEEGTTETMATPEATPYTVVAGDTLGSIARATYGDVNFYDELCAYNEVANCNILEVGQELMLPDVSELGGVATTAPVATTATTATTTVTTTAPAATTATSPVAAGDSTTYTVAAGDTLGIIARDNYGDVQLYDELCAFNNIANCNVIEIGDVIVLPDLATLTGEAPAPVVAETPAETETPALVDIVETAKAAGNFTTLLSALDAAGLTEALQGEGPFTVFAPTDEAFAALPEGTLAALLADPAQLASVLRYHVVAGKVMAADVVGLTSADTLEGVAIAIAVEGDVVKINNATVTTPDIEASNGVIHVIDTVLIPVTQ